MKVAELREVLSRHDPETLRTIVVELYKAAPAALRREKDLDRLVRDPEAWKAARRRGGQKTTVDPEAVCDEAEWFLANAREGNYFKPNRIIPKKERARWRFVAKRLYRELQQAAAQEAWRSRAVGLLRELFEVLCRAEGVYLFTSVTPFEAIRVSKEEFFLTVLALDRRGGDPEAHADLALDLLTAASDSWGPSEELIEALVGHLRTPDMKELAVARATARLRELAAGPAAERRRGRTRVAAAALAHAAVRLLMELAEPEVAASLARRYRSFLGEFAWDALARTLSGTGAEGPEPGGA